MGRKEQQGVRVREGEREREREKRKEGEWRTVSVSELPWGSQAVM